MVIRLTNTLMKVKRFKLAITIRKNLANTLQNYHQEYILVIQFSYTVVKPCAMMINFIDAPIANETVSHSKIIHSLAFWTKCLRIELFYHFVKVYAFIFFHNTWIFVCCFEKGYIYHNLQQIEPFYPMIKLLIWKDKHIQ